jgi:hypothetical protein
VGGNGVPVCALSCVAAPPVAQDAGLGACAFSVPDLGGASREDIEVRADGVGVPLDPTHVNGWAFTDQTTTTFEIAGPTCDAIVAGTVSSICVYCLLFLP